MGAGFAILGLFVIFILVLAIVLFFILKKRGYLKTGIILSSILVVMVLIPVFSFVFESELYFKSDAEDDLKLLNINLKDDFEIISNIIVGVNDYYQTTYLKISNYDKNRIKEEILNAQDFRMLTEQDYIDVQSNKLKLKKSILN